MKSRSFAPVDQFWERFPRPHSRTVASDFALAIRCLLTPTEYQSAGMNLGLNSEPKACCMRRGHFQVVSRASCSFLCWLQSRTSLEASVAKTMSRWSRCTDSAAAKNTDRRPACLKGTNSAPSRTTQMTLLYCHLYLRPEKTAPVA